MKDIVNNRELLDIHRSNSQLIRQIDEVRNRIIAIEEHYGITEFSLIDELTQHFQLYNYDEDIVIMRGANQLLRRELSKYRQRHTLLKNEIILRKQSK